MGEPYRNYGMRLYRPPGFVHRRRSGRVRKRDRDGNAGRPEERAVSPGEPAGASGKPVRGIGCTSSWVRVVTPGPRFAATRDVRRPLGRGQRARGHASQSGRRRARARRTSRANISIHTSKRRSRDRLVNIRPVDCLASPSSIGQCAFRSARAALAAACFAFRDRASAPANASCSERGRIIDRKER